MARIVRYRVNRRGLPRGCPREIPHNLYDAADARLIHVLITRHHKLRFPFLKAVLYKGLIFRCAGGYGLLNAGVRLRNGLNHADYPTGHNQ